MVRVTAKKRRSWAAHWAVWRHPLPGAKLCAATTAAISSGWSAGAPLTLAFWPATTATLATTAATTTPPKHVDAGNPLKHVTGGYGVVLVEELGFIDHGGVCSTRVNRWAAVDRGARNGFLSRFGCRICLCRSAL